MTWADGIAATCGLIAALLIHRHQHTEPRSTTAQQQPDPQDGEQQ